MTDRDTPDPDFEAARAQVAARDAMLHESDLLANANIKADPLLYAFAFARGQECAATVLELCPDQGVSPETVETMVIAFSDITFAFTDPTINLTGRGELFEAPSGTEYGNLIEATILALIEAKAEVDVESLAHDLRDLALVLPPMRERLDRMGLFGDMPRNKQLMPTYEQIQLEMANSQTD